MDCVATKKKTNKIHHDNCCHSGNNCCAALQFVIRMNSKRYKKLETKFHHVGYVREAGK